MAKQTITSSLDAPVTIIEQHGYRYTRVASLEHLKRLAAASHNKGIAEFILLLHGGFRRSKLVQYSFSRNGHHWYVDDMDSEKGRYYTTPQLHRLTMIPKGILAGCFYLEEALHSASHTSENETLYS